MYTNGEPAVYLVLRGTTVRVRKPDEAYLRLTKGQQIEPWNNRGHFFAAAAEAMRRILINRARDKGRLKRGGQWRRAELDSIQVAVQAKDEDLLVSSDTFPAIPRRTG